jgi:hypothetical protein
MRQKQSPVLTLGKLRQRQDLNHAFIHHRKPSQ